MFGVERSDRVLSEWRPGLYECGCVYRCQVDCAKVGFSFFDSSPSMGVRPLLLDAMALVISSG